MNNEHGRTAAGVDRRDFLKAVGGAAAGLAFFDGLTCGRAAEGPTAKIRGVQVADGVTIDAVNGTTGSFKGSRSQDLGTLKSHLGRIRELLVGKDSLDRALSGEILWEAIYSGKAGLYADGRDPLTGDLILNRGSRHRTA